MVHIALIHEVKDHRSEYMRVCASEDRFNYILNCLHPPQNSSGIAFEDKWLTSPNMGHIVATCYNRVVIELTNHEISISETFSQLEADHLNQKPTSCVLV